MRITLRVKDLKRVISSFTLLKIIFLAATLTTVYHLKIETATIVESDNRADLSTLHTTLGSIFVVNNQQEGRALIFPGNNPPSGWLVRDTDLEVTLKCDEQLVWNVVDRNTGQIIIARVLIDNRCLYLPSVRS